MSDNTPGFETRAIHAGASPDPITGARSTPIYQTASYVFEDVEHAASLFDLQTPGFVYSRLGNPTVAVLEERIAALEGARGATATSTGHAAQILALFPLMSPGDEVIAARQLYGGSLNQMANSYKKFGWNARFVDATNANNFRKELTAKTRAIFIENLANPGGIIVDVESVANIAREAGIPLIVDSTMATPYLSQPIEFGADIVVHSTTKFLTGNGTAMGGIVVDSGGFDWLENSNYPSLTEPAPEYHGLSFVETFGDLAYTIHSHVIGLRDLGATQSPLNAWLTLNGIETLALRMERHCSNALEVANFLEGHRAVKWVSYPGLAANRFNDLAKKYFPKGAGAVLTFGLKGGYDTCVKVVESMELFSHLANIGDVRSLIIHPSSTIHRQLNREQQEAAGAGPEVVRLSIGLESVNDIIEDLDQSLARASKT